MYESIAALQPVDCTQRTYLKFRDVLAARRLEGVDVSTQVKSAFATHGIVDSPVDFCTPRPVVQLIQRTVDQIGQHIHLGWSAVQNASFYRVFLRPFDGTSGLDVGDLVADSVTTTDVNYVEPDTSLTLAFIVVPFDAAGNPGPASLETPAYTAVPPAGGTARGRLELSIRPNPARGGATFRLGNTAARPHNLDVFDVAGRLVRSLSPGKQADGTWVVDWDTMDRRGQPVPSGIYLVRNALAEHAVVGRLVVLQ